MPLSGFQGCDIEGMNAVLNFVLSDLAVNAFWNDSMCKLQAVFCIGAFLIPDISGHCDG